MRSPKNAILILAAVSSFALLSSSAGGGRPFQHEEQPLANVLAWNTFCGSLSWHDVPFSMAVDGEGNVVVAGYAQVAWGTPRYAYAGAYDAVVIKFDRSGNRLWHTFLGGAQFDEAWDLALDSGGHIYVAGESEASWGTPRNPFSGGRDAFIAKLDANGVLQWNTFLGSTGTDTARAISCDANWNLFVCGTSSLGWGAPIHAHSGGSDVFVSRIDGNGYRVWHTFLGGGNDDRGRAIALDGAGNIVIGGDGTGTWGTPIVPYAGSFDVFAAKLDGNGNPLWNTFMGSDIGSDFVRDVVLDGAGNLYLTGNSYLSGWGAPINPYFGSFEDVFVAKLDGAGNRLWNTFCGGENRDFGQAIALDGAGHIYLAIDSYGSWGTPRNPYSGMYDACLAKLDNNGNLLWNEFYGTGRNDEPLAVAVDGNGSIYLTGESEQNWGTPVNPNAGNDIFLAKFNQILEVGFSAGGGGTLMGASRQTVPYGGSCSPVTAVPSLYHVFQNWSGNGGFVTSAQNPLTVTNVTADMAIVAHMPAILPPVRQTCERVQNRSLRQIEYINVLRWSANPGNDALNVAAYRVYEVVNGTPSLLAEVGPQTIEYWHRNAGTSPRTYHLVCLVNGVEGEPLEIIL